MDNKWPSHSHLNMKPIKQLLRKDTCLLFLCVVLVYQKLHPLSYVYCCSYLHMTLYLLFHPSIMHSFIPNASPPPALCQLLSLMNTPLLPFLPPHFPSFLCPGLIATILFDRLFVSSYSFSDGLGKTCWLSESGMHTINPALVSGQQRVQPH